MFLTLSFFSNFALIHFYLLFKIEILIQWLHKVVPYDIQWHVNTVAQSEKSNLFNDSTYTQ